jgi:hypothetical protein
MWDSLQGKDFGVLDAANVLLENYDVEPAVANADAQKWIDVLKENGLLLQE